MMNYTIHFNLYLANGLLVSANLESHTHQEVNKLKQYFRVSYPSNVSNYYQDKGLASLVSELNIYSYPTRLLNNIYGLHCVS